jgi:hypothetical protein
VWGVTNLAGLPFFDLENKIRDCHRTPHTLCLTRRVSSQEPPICRGTDGTLCRVRNPSPILRVCCNPAMLCGCIRLEIRTKTL